MKSHNVDHAIWVIKNINKKKGTPYHMANQELADDIFLAIKDKFPEAIMITIGITQWITVTQKAKNKLTKSLNEWIEDYKESIIVMETAKKMLK